MCCDAPPLLFNPALAETVDLVRGHPGRKNQGLDEITHIYRIFLVQTNVQQCIATNVDICSALRVVIYNSFARGCLNVFLWLSKPQKTPPQKSPFEIISNFPILSVWSPLTGWHLPRSTAQRSRSFAGHSHAVKAHWGDCFGKPNPESPLNTQNISKPL